MKPIKIGLLGLGTVGNGTVSVLKNNAEEITRRAGRNIIVDFASRRDLSKNDNPDIENTRLTTDAFDIVNDPEIDIVVELIGGYSPAKELVMQALDNSKHVVTANKALIAIHGNEIFQKAKEKGCIVAFEAAVAGGIPIIKALREGLSANHIEWMAGIINGTGNFILTEMRDKGRSFDDVLTEAQALGYAEADPTFDVEGVDAAHKLTILSSLAFGIGLQFDKTYVEGISNITREDVEYAKELGYGIKHLGIAKRSNDGIEQRVHPTLIPSERILANVNGVMNAVLVHGDAVGPTLYYGAGAGDSATASAVVADIVDIVRVMSSDPDHRVPHLAFQTSLTKELPILPIEAIETTFYLRLRALDKAGVLASITQILAQSDISIEAFIQKEPKDGEDSVDIIMLTHQVLEGDMNVAIEKIEALDSVLSKITRIRVEGLD